MIPALISFAKDNVKKTISFGAIAGILVVGTGVIEWMDAHYLLADEGKKINYNLLKHEASELDNKIFVIDLLENRGQATDVDLAMREKYQRRLEELQKQLMKVE